MELVQAPDKYPSELTIRNVLTRIDAAELDVITCAALRQARKRGMTSGKSRTKGR